MMNAREIISPIQVDKVDMHDNARLKSAIFLFKIMIARYE